MNRFKHESNLCKFTYMSLTTKKNMIEHMLTTSKHHKVFWMLLSSCLYKSCCFRPPSFAYAVLLPGIPLQPFLPSKVLLILLDSGQGLHSQKTFSSVRAHAHTCTDVPELARGSSLELIEHISSQLLILKHPINSCGKSIYTTELGQYYKHYFSL